MCTAAMCFGLVSSQADAQKIYKWTDSEGRVQYTQTPPPDDTKVEQTTVARVEISDERRRYCTAIHGLALHLADYSRRGLPIGVASEALRQVEISRKVDVEEIALRELVNFVYASGRSSYPVEVAGRAQDACMGGSFGRHGRAKVADASKSATDDAEGPRKTGRVTGTGWITHGFVATNYHVVSGKDRIRVRFADGRESSAFLGETDAANDVALLRVGGQLPQGLPLASSEAPIGADVFTLGYPHTEIMGNNAKLSTGIVNSTTGMQDDPRLYQISVPVQSGNSGGPLLNSNGEVVGLVTAKLSAAQVYRWTGDIPQNVNYAVKVRYLRSLVRRSDASGDDLPAISDSLQNHAARIGPSVVLVIAE